MAIKHMDQRHGVRQPRRSLWRMIQHVALEWSPVTVTGLQLDRQAVRMVEPFASCVFATLDSKQPDVYTLRLLPRGHTGPCGFLDFASETAAKRHAFKWCSHHGHKLPQFADGLSHNPAAR